MASNFVLNYNVKVKPMATPASESGKAAAVAAALKPILPEGSITLRDSPDYQSQCNAPWSPLCRLPAAAFVRPRDAKQVGQALSAIRKAGSKFAIRSTGVNPNPGASAVGESGVVIDVSQLKDLSFDEETGILSAGAGCTWGDINGFADKYGRSAIGGRHNAPGVSGFLLGGGMPSFVNLYGFGADNLMGAEVVLADSSIVKTNSEEKPDLLRALKGGGTNYGIVTKFLLKTYPTIKTTYQIHVYNPSDTANIHRATIKMQKAMESDPKIGMFVNFQPQVAAAGLFYAGWEEGDDPPKAFEPFNQLDSLMAAALPSTKGTAKSLVDSISAGFMNPEFRRTVTCCSTKVDEELYLGIQSIVEKARKAHPNITNIVYTNQPVSPAAVKVGEERGGNAMGVQSISQTVWPIVAEWESPSHDSEAEAAVEEVREAIVKLAKEKNLFVDFLLPNDSSIKQKVLASYGEESLGRLRETAERYDPEGVFQKLQNDGFLLRKSLGG